MWVFLLHKNLKKSSKGGYPVAKENYYSVAAGMPEIADTTPKLLFCTAEAFMFWMPMMPAKGRDPHCSIIFKEAEDLLRISNLPRLQKWHCDIVHCYHPDYPGSVLDADNYHTKPILDAIAMAMFAKDSYDNFSIGQYNLPTADLFPGFYIHVVKRTEKVQFF